MPTKSAEAPNGTAKRRKPAAKKQEATTPTREEIARLAEKFWAERGCRKVRLSKTGCARNKN